MKDLNLLLVEGRDDKHVIGSLLLRNGIDIEKSGINIQEEDCFDKLKQGIGARLKTSRLKSLGVIVDADTDLGSRWDSIRDTFRKNEINFDTALSPEGAISTSKTGIRVGVWVMPDNQLPGMLEDFVQLLIRNDDKLLPCAKDSVERAVAIERRFSSYHQSKAIIHTWLSWQPEPGLKMGQAINRKYIGVDESAASKFMTWVRNLLDIG